MKFHPAGGRLHGPRHFAGGEKKICLLILSVLLHGWCAAGSASGYGSPADHAVSGIGAVAGGMTRRAQPAEHILEAGESVGIEVHIFSGNEYVFFIGHDPGAAVEWRVLDLTGTPVPGRRLVSAMGSAAWISAGLTGPVRIEIMNCGERELRVAFLYAFR